MTRTAITIGSFDGVHAGHAKLVNLAREEAGNEGRVVVLSFDPHPLSRLRPGSEPARLTSFAQREQWLKEAGADEVVRLEPTAALLGKEPEAFIGEIVKTYGVNVIVEGMDFGFGKGRKGSVDALKKIGERLGFKMVVADTVECGLTDQSVVRVSSTMTRWLIARGRVRDAARLLGRCYEISCLVVKGDQRGRELGFPTANLAHREFLLPADGVYSGEAELEDGRTYAAAISVGTKPTFGEHSRVCEAHLLGFEGKLDDYGWRIDLRFKDFMRDQLVYTSLQELVEQLQRDVSHVREEAEQGVCA